MSMQWYFQVMGSDVGPLSPAELADKVKRGQIQADTLVRKGADGKWMPADRIKGLLPPPPEADPPPPEKMPVAATTSSAVVKSKTDVIARDPQVDEDDETYHFNGDKAAAASDHAHEPAEFDFFQFVGFRHAITQPLHDVLEAYAQKHHLTFTQITRRALAQFLGRPELGEDKKPELPAEVDSAPADAEGVA